MTAARRRTRRGCCVVSRTRALAHSLRLTCARAASRGVRLCRCANETFRATSVCAEHRTQLDYRQAQGRVREWFCKQQGKGHEKYAACKRIALMNAERELRVAGVRSTPEEMQARFAKISLAEEEEARQVHEIGSAWCAQSEEQYSPFCLQWRAKAQEEAREL